MIRASAPSAPFGRSGRSGPPLRGLSLSSPRALSPAPPGLRSPRGSLRPAAARPVAFAGSRSLPPSARPVVVAAARAAAARGPVAVGSGSSGFPLWVLAGAPGARVFSPSFSGSGALPARAAALVRASGSVLAFPAAPCPPAVVPARSWRSGSPPSGCWSEIALAVGLGLPVVVVGVAVGSAALPAWPGGSWRGFRRPLGGVSLRCWRWVPAQLPLVSKEATL